MNNALDPKPNFPEIEKEVLEFWKQNRIFEQASEKEAPRGNFVFWEGPPTANGRPGVHHVLARTFKDVILRYRTMRGYKIIRKAGWDTHGLPVELAVEKQLGISGKKQIENIVAGDARASIIEFNQRCRESVWEFKEEWEKLTERIGFWLDLKDPYVTYGRDFIDTIWWLLAQIDKRGLLTQGYKSVPYCPRCGTALSSHEVAQGYKDDTVDPSIFVKFKLKDRVPILVWTTTPWTLPGNVALAVNPNEDYVEVEHETIENNQPVHTHLILAKKRLGALKGESQDTEVVSEFKGSDLVGLEYEPLYRQTEDAKAYHVVAADFVSMDDGTGIVHIAPAFGQEDFELGQKLGLPVLRTVDEAGLVMASGDVPGNGQFVKAADKEVVADLVSRGLMYDVGTVKHTYPFCWRCGTPLIYYARDSWYIQMSKLRDELLERNSKINWVPQHIKDGRFGEWLREIKDWAISRDRYWGTPIPIWKCEDCQKHRVLDGLSMLASAIEKRNDFYFVRHGESGLNVQNLISGEMPGLGLTEKGRADIEKLADELREKGITKIIASPLTRTQETAQIIAEKCGIVVETDDRLREVDFGDLNGKSIDIWNKQTSDEDRWLKGAPNGENWYQIQNRMTDALAEYNSRYQGEKIVVVSHGDPLYILFLKLLGVTRLVGQGCEEVAFPETGSVHQFPVNLFDPHRPYVDDLALSCECGGEMHRIPDVLDVWFDSGAMPYAQWHWRGEGAIGADQYPADYISEAIDQTRGWFYTLLAIATAVSPSLPEEFSKEPPYRNVICLGHIQDEKGQKMSKSKGNIVNPWDVIDSVGSDSLRLHLTTMNQPGDPKRFAITGVQETLRRNLLILWNVAIYWSTYKDSETKEETSTQNAALDSWLQAKIFAVQTEVTQDFENYDLFSAGRKISDWINELSTWYVRRSRGRTDKAFIDNLGGALRTTLKLLAPYCPFVTEKLWQALKTDLDKESVHLADWLELPGHWQNDKLLEQMEQVRNLVEMGHASRNQSGLKLRQPLAKAVLIGIKDLPKELEQILLEELNVKAAEYKTGESVAVELDTELTDGLKAEGFVREITRKIQSMRKEAGLQVGEQASVELIVPAKLSELLVDVDWSTLLGTTEIKLREEGESTTKLDLDGQELGLRLLK